MTELELAETIERAVEKALAKHPRPLQINMKQAADMLGVSPMTITRMVRAGKFRLNGCGMIPMSQIDAVLEAH